MQTYKAQTASTEATLRTIQSLVARKLTPSPLDDVAASFEALYRAVRATQGEEAKLSSELEENDTALKARQHELSETTVNVVELKGRKKALMGEIDKLDDVVEGLREKEKARQTKVDAGRTVIDALEKTAEERSTGMMKEHADEMSELEGLLEEVGQRLASKQGTLTTLREEERMQEADVDHLLMEQRETHGAIESVRERIETLQTQVAQTKRKKQSLDSELRATKLKLESTNTLAKEKRKVIGEGKSQLSEGEAEKKRLTDETKACMDNYNVLYHKLHQLSDSISHQERTNASLVLANERVEQAIANYRVEVVEAGKEKKKLEKLMVLTTTKLEDLAREKEKIELKTAALEAKKLEHETAIARTRKAEDFTKKQIDLKRRERATLNRGLGQAKTDSDAMKEMLIVQSNSSKNLESEVLSHQAEALEKRDTIVKIEMERDKHAAEAAAAQEQYEAARDEVEKAEEAVAGVQRRIVDSDARLKQQKALFEAVRADRNVHSKHLLAAQSDIAAMKRKFRLMSRTISQLKDDIMSKERELLRERTQRSLVDKQRERLKAELSRIDKMIKSSGKILVGQKGEISALSEVVQKGDAELTRQEKEYNSVMHERDILRTQLMQRDAEFATLSEKVKLQRSMLAQGTSQFVDLKRQSAGLDQTLENESLNLVDLQKQTEGIDGLRNDMYRLERDLIAEQTKIKALSEELERPLNIHRWRALEGSDPERFALLKRVATLQKRLITKTEEVAKTGLLIQQKEQAYNDLKQLLERRPGQDVAEQLAVYQSNLKDKKRNCRQVEEEVLRYKQEVSDHRNVLRSLHTRMDELKQLYFVEARRGGGRGGSLRFPQMESGGGGSGVAGKMQLDAAPGSEAPSTLFFGHGEATEGGGMRTVPPLDSSDDDDEY